MSSTAAPARPDARAWFVLGMLCFVYVLNFLDRQLLSILAKPIQDDLQVTDGQLGPHQRPVFRAVLLPDLDSRRVARGSDQPRARAVVRVRAVERGDGRLRIGGHLSAARRRADDGGRRRGGRRAAFLRDHLRLLSSGHARHGARAVQSRPADRAGAGRRLRRVDRGRLQLAKRVRRARRCRHRRGGHGLSVRSRAGARRSRSAPIAKPAATTAQAGFWATVAMFFSRPVLLLVALATGATQFVTYATLNFTTLFLMREKGMTLNEIAI